MSSPQRSLNGRWLGQGRLLPLLLSAGVVAALGDWLLWGTAIGWGAGVLVLVLAMAIARHRPPRGPGTWPAWACVAVGVAALVVEPGPLAWLWAGCGLAGLALAGCRNGSDRLAELPGLSLRLGLGCLSRVGSSVGVMQRLRQRTQERAVAAGRRRLRWQVWLPAGAGAVVFVALFAIANPVIAGQLDSMAQWLDHLPALEGLRLLFWLSLATVTWLLARSRPAQRLRAASRRSGRQRLDQGLDPTAGSSAETTAAILRALAVFNLVFLWQNGVDLWYLWGGGQLPTGMTWATYAHRGAYPLVATALLAAAIVLRCVRPGGDAETSRGVRFLVYAWLIQNVVLCASAAWRLHLYVDVFGLTRLRVAAALWMLLVACGLGLIAYRLARAYSNAWLIEANARVLAIALGWAALVDHDGRIAAHNLARWQAGEAKALDLAYLESLGPAALPPLVKALEQVTTASDRAELIAVIARLTGSLQLTLSDPRAWTVLRGRARTAAAAAEPSTSR